MAPASRSSDTNSRARSYWPGEGIAFVFGVLLVTPAPGERWPEAKYLRQGVRAHGWFLATAESMPSHEAAFVALDEAPYADPQAWAPFMLIGRPDCPDLIDVCTVEDFASLLAYLESAGKK